MEGPDPTPEKRAARLGADGILFGLIVLGTLAHLAYYFPRVVDDLFISLRYAENLAHGRGAVYNVGERVEGYSSPLWMLLQSAGYVLHVEGVTWTKACGVVSLLGLEYALFRLTRDALSVQGPLALLPSACCAANSYVVNWSILGLETPLHLALLVLCPVALHRALRGSSPRADTLAALALTLTGVCRPESPLYVALNVAAPLLAVRTRAELAHTTRALLRFTLPALAALGIFLAIRYGYYGHLVPNTYFVKGRGETFDVRRLAPLWSEGASAWESALYLGGIALSVYYAWARRSAAPALTALLCLYFTASVRLDWMPSLRHLLPVTVLAPVGFACLGDDLARRRAAVGHALRAALAVVPALASLSVLSIDNRNSPEENRGRGWIRPKERRKWEDTRLAYRRVEPPHVRRMGTYDMGQITQAWHVLEASAAAVEESWYVGRDIGSVGYYTGVRVYDTAGLFTAEVSHDADWTERRRVSNGLIRKAMARRPLAAELFEGWELALGRNPELLDGYRIRRGSRRTPSSLLATDRPRPSAAEVKRRYRAMLAKLPTLYHLHTLYGESLGAVVEKRLRFVEASFGK